MTKQNLFPIAVYALIASSIIACSGKLETKTKEFVNTNGESPHQQKIMDQVTISSELKKFGVDVTNTTTSKDALAKKYFDSKSSDLERINYLLDKYVHNGMMLITQGDTSESNLATVENAKELLKISTSYAVTLAPELNF